MAHQAMPAVVDFACQTFADLTVLPRLALSDGCRAWVSAAGATHGLWCLDDNSVAVVDNLTVVATIDGIGRWLYFGASAAPTAGLPQSYHFSGLYLNPGDMNPYTRILANTGDMGGATDTTSTLAPDYLRNIPTGQVTMRVEVNQFTFPGGSPANDVAVTLLKNGAPTAVTQIVPGGAVPPQAYLVGPVALQFVAGDHYAIRLSSLGIAAPASCVLSVTVDFIP